MTPNDDTRDEELLARYRQAGDARDAGATGPSDTVREAILAESRSVAAELAKQARRHTVDVSRPAANDSRWKIPVFGTAGAALLAALLFVPRYWENAPAPQQSAAPAAAPGAPAAAREAAAAAPAPKLQEVEPYPAPSKMAQADRKSSQAADALSLDAPAPAPGTAASVGQNYAPVSPSASPLPAAPPVSAARARPLDLSARAATYAAEHVPHVAESGALSMSADRASGGDNALKSATLESAVAQGDVAQAASLLDQGAVIDARDEAGRTPLMIAVSEDRREIVRLLLERGADPNAADNTGHTPLQQATKRNLREIAALLEQAGAR